MRLLNFTIQFKAYHFCSVCTVYSVKCTLYSVQCTVYSAHFTVYTVHCTVNIVSFKVSGVDFTVYRVQFNSVQCTVLNVQCTVYSVHFPLYSIQGYLLLKKFLSILFLFFFLSLFSSSNLQRLQLNNNKLHKLGITVLKKIFVAPFFGVKKRPA